MIYLDYQATTPVAPEVVAVMRPWAEEKFANPHSPSKWGREAAAAIEHARDQILTALGLDEGRFVFTSGATEALNWAIAGTLERSERRKIVTISTEHAAVLDTCEWLEGRGYRVVRLPVGGDGLIDLDAAAEAIDDQTALVAAMLVNNEIGVIQPIAELTALAHRHHAPMLCDAVQAFGRVAIPQGPDLIALSAHKIYGPKGIGGLWIRKGFEPRPLLYGGGQEQGLRSGTLSPALCAGFGEAARLAEMRSAGDQAHVEKLWEVALSTFGADWEINGSAAARYHGNLNLRRDGLDGARLMADLRNIAFSLGSACASGSGRPSHVLRAIGLSDRQARSSIRLGFGRYTGEAELASACRHINEAALLQRQYSA
ncbi:cysteine desulfurase family protein [Sphingomonas jaspsi]|uniref:cysteine desulfurase family protein n=1 Tax=Sphingomonas jaspsi TaxID=392409 RepID=UPI0004B0B027|nr:cysteine desulfurase family protein [Sphingomonas jaspsi]